MTMFFDGPTIAHVHASWLAPVKVRRTLLGGSQRMIVFDDLEGSEKIKIYDSGISVDPSPENVYQMLVGYRTGDMWAPKLALTEALAAEASHFVRCVTDGTRPQSDGEAGLRVVRLLEAASASMQAHGRPVDIQGVAAG
jgi:predicted dehydrogenase